MSLLALAMGIVMVLGIGADMIIIMLGASLILDGLQNLIHAIFSTAHRQRLVRLYKKALEEQIAEETAALEAQKAEEILPPEPSETPEVLEKAELSEPEEVPVPERLKSRNPKKLKFRSRKKLKFRSRKKLKFRSRKKKTCRIERMETEDVISQ
jgi:tRNA A22 N-methylase